MHSTDRYYESIKQLMGFRFADSRPGSSVRRGAARDPSQLSQFNSPEGRAQVVK